MRKVPLMNAKIQFTNVLPSKIKSKKADKSLEYASKEK